MDEERLRRHDLTDAEWGRLAPLLPRHPRQGHRWNDHRLVLDGIFFRTRTGCPWRDLPERFGHWKTIYHRHRRWSADGTWEMILDALRTGCDQGQGRDWAVAVDATVVRAHQHAAGARHQPPADVDPARLAPADEPAGHHRPGGGSPRTRPGRVLGDKAYSSTAIRAHLRRRGIKATILQRSDQVSHRRRRGSRAGRPPVFDPAAYKDRNTVERAFNQLRQHRAVATRYDKRDFIWRGTIDVATIRIWLRHPPHDLKDTR